MATVKIKIEKEYAEEILTAINNVLSHDDEKEFLGTNDYNALEDFKDTLMFKLGRVL